MFIPMNLSLNRHLKLLESSLLRLEAFWIKLRSWIKLLEPTDPTGAVAHRPTSILVRFDTCQEIFALKCTLVASEGILLSCICSL